MVSTVIATYIGCSIYYGIKAIKKSIKDNTIDKDIEYKWNCFVERCKQFKENNSKQKK